MNAAARFVRHVAGLVGDSLLTCALWSLWLGLVLLAAAQVYVLCTSELAVPAFVLRRLEDRLAETGVRVTFDRARFDPTGRILVEGSRVFLPEYADPVLSARAGYVGLNPWLLAVGKVDVGEIRLVAATVSVPAMLSPSGRAEPIVRDIDTLIVPGADEVAIRYLSARWGPLRVSARGAIARRRGPPRLAVEIANALRTQLRAFCRPAVDATRRLEALADPTLDLALIPSPTRGAIVGVTFGAAALQLDAVRHAELAGIRARTEFPLLGGLPALWRLDAEVDRITAPGLGEAGGVMATVRGRMHLAAREVEPLHVEIAARSVVTPRGSATDLSATLVPKSRVRWTGDVAARLLDAPLAIKGEADLAARTAALELTGAISPRAVDVVNTRLRFDLRNFFKFESLELDRVAVRFGAGWKFEEMHGRARIGGIDAKGVRMDEGCAVFELDPRRFYAPEAYARIGGNFARGSYEHCFATRQFRFLLDGRLRPLDIADWFQEWWPRFFQHFEFPVAAPAASVDVQGIWRQGRRSSVFVLVDSDATTIMGQPLGHARTRLFIRPGFYDALEAVAADQAGGIARGTFTLTSDVGTGKWRTLDLDATSGVALQVVSRIGAHVLQPILEPFEVAHPPQVKLRGHFDGPGVAEAARRRTLDLTARTTGGFKFHHFPLQDVSFAATLRGDEIVVDDVEAKFAGGRLRGKSRVWDAGPARRIRFDGTLVDASLGQVVAAGQNFTAERQGKPRPPAGRFVQEKANVRVDLTAEAEGTYGNHLSFHGTGNVALRGPEIGEVPLFGPLSELLKFTALRFTTGRANFKINGAKLEFSDVALRGANSAIDAHGDYLLDRRQLDFRAKVFPFQESGNVIKSVVGAVLAPISNVLEVKLTGTLEAPDWAFVLGPTNLLRSLAEPAEPPVPAPPGSVPPATAGPATLPPAPGGSPAPTP